MGPALLIGLTVAAAVLLFCLGIYFLVERHGDVSARVEHYASLSSPHDEEDPRKHGLRRTLISLDRVISGQAFARRLGLRLTQANLRLTVPEFLGAWLLATVGGGLLGLALRGHMLSGIAGAVIGLGVPWLWLSRRRDRRLHLFQDQLVDVLVLIVGSLRSGHGLLNAMEVVAKELEVPAGEEFARVQREIGFGLSQVQALDNLATRMESEDLRLMVTAISINQEVGGNLSLVLDKIAETIRERVRLLGEVRVLTTQQRLTSYLLVGLPFFLALVLFLVNPEWMMQLFRPPWYIVPAVATASTFVGYMITRRVIRIDV